MKHRLSRFALMLAAATSASGASAVTNETCAEFVYSAFPTVFGQNTRRCPASEGVINKIASLTRMQTSSTATRFVYTYSVEMITAPGPLLQPRAAAVLLKSNGTPVVSADGPQCAEGVDATNGGGPGSVKTCSIVKQASASMARTRVIHQVL